MSTSDFGAYMRRIALLSRLSRSGCLAPHTSQRFASRMAGTSAAKVAGLDRYLALEHIAPSHARSLAAATAVLRNALMLPEQSTGQTTEQPTTAPAPPPAQPRYRFRAEQQ
jgi:hypothetical protein